MRKCASFNLIFKRNLILYTLILCSILGYCSANESSAANLVSWQVVRQGSTDPVDTIYVGGKYQIQIMIENDIRLGGMSVPLTFRASGNEAWEWDDPVMEIIPGCRMENAWDMTGVLVTYYDMDNISPDYLDFGGVALQVGMDPGPLEPMIGFNFTANINGPWDNGLLGAITVDSGAWIYNYHFIFVDVAGGGFTPDFAQSVYRPVVMICGNPNGDDDINVGDPVFLINHIFRQGPGPNPFLLGDANLDGDVNVGDVIFLINSSFLTGPRPECPAEE